MCDATRFRIRIGGQDMPEDWRWLSNHLSLYLPESGIRRLKLEMPVSSPDWKRWSGGEPVALSLGYADDMEALFEGEITGMEVVQDTDGAQWVALVARDKLHRLGRSHKRRLFERVTEGRLIRTLASSYGLRAQVEDPGEVLSSVLQANDSDLALLQARAGRLGYLYWLERDTLHFASRRPSGPAITLQAGEQLTRLETLISATRTPSKVSVLGHNPARGERVKGEARAQQVPPTAPGRRSGASQVGRAFASPEQVFSTLPVHSVKEAQTVARGQLTRQLRQFAVARGTCEGTSRMRPGLPVMLEGVPPLSQGKWELCTVEHVLDGQGGYVTHFEARRNSA